MHCLLLLSRARMSPLSVSLFVCIWYMSSGEPFFQVPPTEANIGLAYMVLQSVPPAVRGARGGGRGVGRKHSQKQPSADAIGDKTPTRRAPLPRPTHCNYFSSIIRQKITSHETPGASYSAPYCENIIALASISLISFDHTRVTMPGCASSWRGLDSLCSTRPTHLSQGLTNRS